MQPDTTLDVDPSKHTASHSSRAVISLDSPRKANSSPKFATRDDRPCSQDTRTRLETEPGWKPSKRDTPRDGTASGCIRRVVGVRGMRAWCRLMDTVQRSCLFGPIAVAASSISGEMSKDASLVGRQSSSRASALADTGRRCSPRLGSATPQPEPGTISNVRLRSRPS